MSNILADVLDGAGITSTSIIRVTGPAGLAALLWLCRHGYQHVGYMSGDLCLVEEADLLLVPQTCDGPTLENILSHGLRPREGGVLIAQTPDGDWPGASDPVDQMLAARGYRVERCVRGHHRTLRVARRSGVNRQQVAA